jgi:hypothetical protein
MDLSQILEFRKFALRFLKIKDEYGDIIPLEFNYAQEKVLEKIKGFKDKPIRLIILKARQVGISTLIQAWIFHYIMTHFNQLALTMGHKVDASNNLFDMFKRYYDNLPKLLMPVLEKSNEKKLSFRKLKSENKIDTAGAGEVGRSDTLQALHLTEVAFYPDAKATLLGLLQGAKYSRIIVKESTANGIGDYFYNDWVDAIEGRSDYIPVFVSWLEFPNYKKPFDREEERESLVKDLGSGLFNEYEGEEKMLLEGGAALEQLNWRRWAIKNLCQNDVTRFHQEYPSTWMEAFVSSGRPVFPQSICNQNKVEALRLQREGLKPLKTGDLVFIYDEDMRKTLREQNKIDFEQMRYAVKGVEFVESSRGFIKIWGEPQKGGTYRYAAGVDVAEGLAQGDRSTIRVLDREFNEVILTWTGHIDADLLAEEIYKIWLFLNKDCHFAVETNFSNTTVRRIFAWDVNVYYREKFTRGYASQTNTVGFQTNIKTKKDLVDTLIEWIRLGLFKDYEPEFWGECLTFVRNARGQMQAEGKDTDPSSKCFDDRVIAEGIMLICNHWLPSFIPVKTEETYSRSYIVNSQRSRGETKF